MQILKVSVIRAKVDDDIATIVNYLRQASNTKVFLVLPLGNDLVFSKVGLKTLLKKAVEFKKELVVSLPTVQAEELAKEIGLVATTIKRAADVPMELWKKAGDLLLKLSVDQLYDIKGVATESRNKADTSRNLSGVDIGSVVKDAPRVTVQDTKTKIAGLQFDSRSIRRKDRRMLFLILSLFLMVVLAIIGSIFFIYYRFFPRVYVNVVLKALKVEKMLNIKGNTGLEGIAPDKAELGIYEIVLTDEETISKDVTTETEEGTYAEGKVNVYNGHVGAGAPTLHIPEGAVFIREDGKRYVSLEEGDVLPGAAKTFRIRATEIGEEYNVGPSTPFVVQVPNFDPDKDAATNSDPITGGSKTLVKVVAKEEVDAAIKETEDLLKKQLIEELKQYNRDKGYRLIEDSVSYEVLETQVDPAIGTKADQFTVTVKVRAKALFYREDELKLLTEQILLKEAKKQFQNAKVQYSVSNIDINDVSIKVKDKNIEFKVGVSASLGPKVDEQALYELIMSQKNFFNIREALVEKFGDSVKALEVGFSPDWIPQRLWYIPQEPTRITLNIRTVE